MVNNEYIFGQRNPTGLAWLQSLDGFVSLGSGHPNALAFEFATWPFDLRPDREPTFYVYDRRGRVLSETQTSNITDINQVIDIASFGRGIAVLESNSRIVKVFNNQFRYSDALTFSLHADNTRPAAIAWNGAAFIIYDLSGTFFFYGDEVVVVPAQPPVQQFTNLFNRTANTYDVYRRIGSTYRLIASDIICIAQSRASRLDFSGQVNIRAQQEYFDLIPKFIQPQLRVDDIIIPAEADKRVGYQTPALPTVDQFVIDGVTINGNRFQSFVCKLDI